MRWLHDIPTYLVSKGTSMALADRIADIVQSDGSYAGLDVLPYWISMNCSEDGPDDACQRRIGQLIALDLSVSLPQLLV